MRFHVRQLRDRGRRLSVAEIMQSEVMTGRLWVRDVRQQITQVTILADLWDDRGRPERRVLGPIMNPHIARWDRRGVLLSGTEVETDGTTVHEHAQIWWLIPEGGDWETDPNAEEPASTRNAAKEQQARLRRGGAG